jgi:cyclopropane-fatty-acyl-phospholipid synthase
MGLFSLEHSKAAYRADFALYGIGVVASAAMLLVAGPQTQWLQMAALGLLGLASWTLAEYVLHRFVLHGLQPFRTWHAEHHLRPRAFIFTPTILSAALIAGLVFAPAFALGGIWNACALTLGVSVGYVAYTITHHATHHWRAERTWLKQRKRWHALHHAPTGRPGCYGVTSGFWDRVFGSGRP